MKNLLFLSILSIFMLLGCSVQELSYEKIDREHAFFETKEYIEDEGVFDESLSLDKAVSLAYVYNKKLLSANKQKDVSKGKVLESISNFLPSFEANGAYTYLQDRTDLKTNSTDFKIGSRDNLSFTLQATQALFTGGALLSNYKAVKIASFITDENLKSQYQKLYFDVAKAYFDILLAEKLLYVHEKGLESAKNHLSQVNLRKDLGFTSDYDVLRSEVEVANFEANVLKEKNKLSLYKTIFLKLLGTKKNQDIQLKTALSYKPYDINEENALKMAFEKRPDYKSKYLEKDLQSKIVNIAKSEFFPKVFTTVAHRWGTKDANITTPIEWAKDLNVSVGFKLDVLDFGRKRGKLKQQQAVFDQKQIDLLDITESICLEVKQAIINLNDAKEFVRSQKLDLKRAKKAHGLAQEGYKEGFKTELEVMDALLAFTRSQSLYYQSLYQYNLALIQLKLTMGSL